MAENLQKISKEVVTALGSRARKFARGSLFIKLILVAVGSAVASALQFMQVPDGQRMTSVQSFGVAASIIVCMGAFYLAITEEDASEHLFLAHEALEEVREANLDSEQLDFYEDIISRQIALYQTFNAMRSGIETSVLKNLSPDKFCPHLLKLASYMLPVATGFQQEDRWTICIYRAEVADTGSDLLRCIAHSRRIDCEISEARTWREGVGVAGIAYANGQEVIVPDMRAAGLGTIFNLASESRDYDGDRYRSIAAVPIKLEGQSRPWGIVVATSDQPGHFDHLDMTGLQTAEGLRLVAGMLGIAIAAFRDNSAQAEL